ncbi:hypothetical protein CK203_087883 [Vitis vinifera]|uniref:Uncharacterized protein n=1 Tax=Vitis vinifera TaxID=29760 RepID=A0A438DQX8_VITVI|nr:hypothetical protein CK203_087883 [Vitis vinifera]
MLEIFLLKNPKILMMVWAHNTRTGQTFHTKKDLLRYVHYAENVLPLFASKSKFILSSFTN